MPCKNVLKTDIDDCYYHIYARGHNRRPIFREDYDYYVFLNLLKRYLSKIPEQDNSGREYPNLYKDLELLSYCLMPNHFHLLIYQINQGTMTKLMRCVMSSYSRYFNKKYKTSGSLFETRFKASLIDSDAYLMHISRYIHLNPGNWHAYRYSSIHAYFGIGESDWLRPQKIIDLFGSAPIYADFLDDYKDYKQSLKEIKDILADK
jgi:putative transposase